MKSLKDQLAEAVAKKGGTTHITQGGTTPTQTDKSEKAEPPKKNGGKRPGSGRKPLELDEKRKSIKQAWEEFADEEVEVRELDKGTREVRKRKMSRLRVSQERLFKKVMDSDVSAIREFNDRVGGKARQPIVGDDSEDPIRINHDVGALIDKAYGDDPE